MYRDFWEAGHRVFGLHPIVKGQCGCGSKDCNMAGKHPRAANWIHTPVWSEEQIETMEEMGQFKTGYGVLMRGLFVIDIDARNDGVASYERLKNDFPAVEKAGLIVNTGSGGGSQHLYFHLPEGIALMQHHPDYPGIDFKSSGYVVGPGSLHASGNRYEVAYGSVEDIDNAPADLIEALRKPEFHRAEVQGSFFDVSHKDLAEMVSHIDPDTDHETWVKCGMAMHHATGGTAFDVWDQWSARGTKYPGRHALEKRWHSFGKSANPVTLGTLIHYAEQAGWKQPVTFDSDIEVPEPPQVLDIGHIDLKRPPGFVGEVAAWIEANSRRVREHLSVASALMSIANLVGLRYTDDRDGVTANMFIFCIAASGTGKDSQLACVNDIMRAAHIERAVHGTIKSEQEIVRNMVRNQASFYAIDEVGFTLKKIKNAQKTGTSSYLEGIVGCLMSAYSKATKFYLVTGDMKEEIRNSLKKELKQIEGQDNPSPGMVAKALSLKRHLETIDRGIEKPFISLIGYATLETFNEAVDFYNATNGFIGRSLIIYEHKTNPPLKRNFKPVPMPEAMQRTFQNLYSGGRVDLTTFERVEFYDDRIPIPTTVEGLNLLEQIIDAFEQMAEEHTATTGLEALALRAYEQVSKISLILAAPHGLRTEEHILWAYAFVRRDVEQKMRLVTSNDREKDSPLMALRAKIMTLISGDDGETLGVICNRLRKNKKADIEKALDELVKVGGATVAETKHPKNGKVVKTYKSTG
jgi:hypothetical protein